MSAQTVTHDGQTRAHRRFWVLRDDGSITRETGYSCAPFSPNEFWFPALERTLKEGSECFRSKAVAKDIARVQIPKRIAEHEAAIATLRANLNKAAP